MMSDILLICRTFVEFHTQNKLDHWSPTCSICIQLYSMSSKCLKDAAVQFDTKQWQSPYFSQIDQCRHHAYMWVSKESPWTQHSECSSSTLKSFTDFLYLLLLHSCLYCSTGFSPPSLSLRSPKHITATIVAICSSRARPHECAPGCLSSIVFLTVTSLIGVSPSGRMVNVDLLKMHRAGKWSFMGEPPL